MATYNVHAGHCPSGQGASGAVGFLNESNEARAVKNHLIAALKSGGDTVYDCTDDTNCSVRENLKRIVSKCNAHSVNKDISIHLNAGKGTGVEVWIRNTSLQSVAAKICANVSESLGIANRGVKQTSNLYVLNHTTAPALLVECCFVDNENDYSKWNAQNCANAIFSALTGKTAASPATWIKDSIGWWYRNADGSYPSNGWTKINGEWYYFNAKGYALANQWLYDNNKWYYLNKDCKMVTGWLKDGAHWFYMGKDGAMLDGWQKVDNKWYYLDEDGEHDPHGAMVTGKVKIDGHTYILKDAGDMITGWYKDNDDWYYFNKDNNCQPIGSMMYNHWVDDKYFVKEDGKMASNESIKIGDQIYTFNTDGSLMGTTN